MERMDSPELSTCVRLNRWSFLLVISLMLLAPLLMWPATAQADPNANCPSEPGHNADPNVLMCDDFEDGDWAQTNCDFPIATPGEKFVGNDGWCMTIYWHNLGGGNANGTTGNGFNPPPVPGYVQSPGFGGTTYTATSDTKPTQSPAYIGGAMMGTHGFKGGATVDDLYWRLYFQPQLDYNGGHEKMFDFAQYVRASGGEIMGLCYNEFGGEKIACIEYHHQNAWLLQNQGKDITMIPGHWYYFESRIKLNTPGVSNGIYEMWMDDCGTSGTLCTGTPTLRLRHTTAFFRDSGTEKNFDVGAIWLENWANAGSQGTLYYDQMVVRKGSAGLIGFMGSTPVNPPPAAPTNLRVQ
jgi:hypothetical protein